MIIALSQGLNRRRQWHPTPVLLPGKSHGWKSLVGCSPWDRSELDTTERLHFHFSLSCTGEGNGNPLQCSCLENPRDGGVAQSQTRLKRPSRRLNKGFPDGASDKEPSCQCRKYKRGKFNPGLGGFPGGGHGNPLQYFCLENRMNRPTWQATVHGVADSDMTEAT